MQVLNEFVIIDPLVNETTSSGIILNNVKIKNVGIVVAIDSVVPNLKIGDKVVYDPKNALPFNYQGRDLFACKFFDIICILK